VAKSCQDELEILTCHFHGEGDIQQDMLSPPLACEDHQTECEANLICLPATHPDDLQLLYQNSVQTQQQKSWPAIQEYFSLLFEG